MYVPKKRHISLTQILFINRYFLFTRGAVAQFSHLNRKFRSIYSLYLSMCTYLIEGSLAGRVAEWLGRQSCHETAQVRGSWIESLAISIIAKQLCFSLKPECWLSYCMSIEYVAVCLTHYFCIKVPIVIFIVESIKAEKLRVKCWRPKSK